MLFSIYILSNICLSLSLAQLIRQILSSVKCYPWWIATYRSTIMSYSVSFNILERPMFVMEFLIGEFNGICPKNHRKLWQSSASDWTERFWLQIRIRIVSLSARLEWRRIRKAFTLTTIYFWRKKERGEDTRTKKDSIHM